MLMRVECIDGTAVSLLMPLAVANDTARKDGIAPTHFRFDRTEVREVLSFWRGVAAGKSSLATVSLVGYTATRRDSVLQAAVATTTTTSGIVLPRNPVDPTRAAVAVAIAAGCRCGEATQTEGGGS